jgi:8-oxo-dGTP pyrophosphatase MutT (NUDIX family)
MTVSAIVRPRDAASLIPYRRSTSGKIEILMGRRHVKHSFVPEYYVFPGGRVDPDDRRALAATDARDDVTIRVARSCRNDRNKARAFAMAAIRETYEETGLMLGKPGGHLAAKQPKSWHHVVGSGLAPDLQCLDYVARARTPTQSPIRFDARFFLADASAAEGELAGSGELEDLKWRDLEQCMRLQLIDVTEFLLGELLPDYFENPPSNTAERPVPFFCFVGMKSRVIDG